MRYWLGGLSFLLVLNSASAAVGFLNGMPSGTLPAGTTAVTVTFNTTPSASLCRYSTVPNIPFTAMTSAFSMRGTSLFYHTMTGLSNGGSYTYYIRCTDPTYSENQQDYVISFSIGTTPSPVITEVSGSLSSDGTITLSGANFGSKTPAAPLVWDNFESGFPSTYLKDHSSWVPNAGTGASYSSAQAYSGKLSAHNRVTATSGTSFFTNHIAHPLSDKIYASYRFRIDSSSVDKYGVLKLSRLASNYDGPVTHTDYYNGPGNSTVFHSNPNCTTGGIASSYDSGNSVTQRYNGAVSPGVWQRYEMYKELSTPGVANGQVFFSWNGQMGWRDFNVMTRDAGFTYQLNYFTLGLMLANARNDGDFSLYIDDVYVDNTLARIEICDKPTWLEVEKSGAHCEPQLPTSWSTNSITARVNPGTFSGGPAYLYVIDQQGNVSAGKPISFIAGKKPQAPGNLQAK